MNDIKGMLYAVQNVALQGLKSGQDIGYRDGLLRAIAICEETAKMHSQYLPAGATYLKGDLAQAATCGRRDECTAMVHRLRAELARITERAA